MNTRRPYNELSDGSRWYFGSPPTELSVDVVAASLAQLARWGGQAKLVGGFVYNVGQHSIKVSYLEDTLTALMHDAHEIIVGDVCSPMKKYMARQSAAFRRQDTFQALDFVTAEAFSKIFRTDFPMSAAVKRADVLIGLIESFDLMPKNGANLWWSIADEDTVTEARELYRSRPELRPEAWSPIETRQRFIARYWSLSDVRT